MRIIAAVDSKWGIGKNNSLPWHIPEDLKTFKKLTHKHAVIMGSETAKSLPFWLPERVNIVVTSKEPKLSFETDKVKVITVSNVKEALKNAGRNPWIIGGQSLYEQTILFAEELYITAIEGDFDCDRFFPTIPNNFTLIERSKPKTNNGYTYQNLLYRAMPTF